MDTDEKKSHQRAPGLFKVNDMIIWQSKQSKAKQSKAKQSKAKQSKAK